MKRSHKHFYMSLLVVLSAIVFFYQKIDSIKKSKMAKAKVIPIKFKSVNREVSQFKAMPD